MRSGMPHGVSALFGLSLAALQSSAGLAQMQGEGQDEALPPAVRRAMPVYIEQDSPRIAVLHANGQQVVTEWENRWRPMCGSDVSEFGLDELVASARRHHAEFGSGKRVAIIDFNRHEGGEGEFNPAAGINIVFSLGSSVPSAAYPAFAAAEAYLETLFSDPVTVTVTVSFANLGNGVLGSTGSYYTNAPWATSRSGMISGMDANDTIQSFLPSGSTIPVRYNGSRSTVTNETRVFWTRAAYNATVGSVSGNAATMQYNTNFSWDWDPSNGVSGYSFQDVIIHEVGHSLGFTSGADFRNSDIEALDIFRFQNTDGSGDYNPDTTAEFQVRARTVDYNTPNDDANSDTIANTHRMSDGNPYQASHFREQYGTSNIGLMDPALGSNQTFYPNFFKAPDLEMFDAIGWSR